MKTLRAWWNFRKAVTEASRGMPTRPAGSKDVIVLPCWQRPEFLWHCLDNLKRAEGIADLHILCRPDTGYSPDNLEVIRSFSESLPGLEIQFPQDCPYRRTKQSANVLLGYLEAARTAKQHVFLIEEDIMVAPDFFRWHRAAHAAAGELFCSIAVKNPIWKHQLPDDAETYYLSHGDYCSLGVCFDKRVLQRLLTPHVNMAYMRRPKRYVRRHFAASALGIGYVEQDGLLRRIQEHSRLPIAYPCLPRAFHAGFYGYHRPGGIAGSLPERLAALGQIIYSPEQMRKAAVRPEFIEDSVPISMQPLSWSVLRQFEVDQRSAVPTGLGWTAPINPAI